MSGYVLSVDADLDLESIWEYIAGDSIDAADRWIGRLFDAFERIGKTPGIGHKREDLTVYPVLFWPVGAYLIIYRTGSGPVEIVAVTQGARHTIIYATAFRPLSYFHCLLMPSWSSPVKLGMWTFTRRRLRYEPLAP